MAEVICTPCRDLLNAGDGIDTRSCFVCGAMVCREESRKARVRVDGGEWRQVIACKDPFACAVRHGERVIT